MYFLQIPETYQEHSNGGVSVLEFLGILLIVGLGFVFHMVVYSDDWVKKWYWKVLIGGGILTIGILAIMGY
tara:strand:+ start:287 stop:499 length:213 start_codon:yes stop_codon:yes gene_type:complete